MGFFEDDDGYTDWGEEITCACCEKGKMKFIQ